MLFSQQRSTTLPSTFVGQNLAKDLIGLHNVARGAAKAEEFYKKYPELLLAGEFSLDFKAFVKSFSLEGIVISNGNKTLSFPIDQNKTMFFIPDKNERRVKVPTKDFQPKEDDTVQIRISINPTSGDFFVVSIILLENEN